MELGETIKRLRQHHRLSQIDLAGKVGLSQRHLSCLETGKAKPSRAMLIALLDGLEVPMQARNPLLNAAGFAPAYSAKPLNHPDMQLVQQVIELSLQAHNPCPAMVLDSTWNLVRYNEGLTGLLALLGFSADMLGPQPNMLRTLTDPNGISSTILNRSEVQAEVLARANREAAQVPALHQLLRELGLLRPALALLPQGEPTPSSQPVLLTRFQSTVGELQFLSTFTTFGSPQDITVASLRIEHLFPANAHTRQQLQNTTTPQATS